MLDTLLYGALPYVAIILFLLVSIQRYRNDPFTFSSLSSQFLETRKLVWGSVPFHVGILTLFFGHLIGFLFPRQVILWNRVPVRLFIIETAAFVAAILCLVGLIGLIVIPRLWPDLGKVLCKVRKRHRRRVRLIDH